MPEYETIKSQVQQARSQLESQKRTVESEEEKMRRQEKLLTSLITKKPQRKLGYQRDPRYAQRLQRHLAEQKFKKEQRPILEEAKKRIKEYRHQIISPYETGVSKAEGQISSYEKEKVEWSLAHKYVDRDRFPFGESKSLQKKYAQIIRHERAYEEWKEQKELKKVSIPSPQLAYKDPSTGQMFSYLPEYAPKGFIPVAITPAGVELPFMEQLKLRAEVPEISLEGYKLVEKPPMKETIGAPTKAFVPITKPARITPKEVWRDIWKVEEAVVKSTIGMGRKAFKKTIGYVPEFYVKAPTMKELTGVGFIPFITVGKPPKAEWEVKVEKKQEELRIEAEEEVGKEIAELSLKERVEPEFIHIQSEYDIRWGEKIGAGEITHEEAVKKFGQSEYYKKEMGKYNRRIQEEYKKEKAGWIWKKPPKWRDIKIRAYGIAARIPTRIDVPTGVVRGAEVGVAIGLMKKFPKITGAYIFGYRFPKAVYEIVTPKTMPTEKLMAGAELAVVTGLGARVAYKYARSPILTTKEIIVSPKLRELEKALRISPTLERQVFTMEGEAKFIKDLHKMAKLDEQLVTGRRVIVTTKIRKKLGLKELYGGVPYSEPKAYGKALKKLQKYGLTETQARASLRYYQPRALMSEMKGVAEVIYGEAMVKPEIHIRKAARVMTPEQRIIDEALGIKTRVGKRRVEYIAAKGEEISAEQALKELKKMGVKMPWVEKELPYYKFITKTEEALITKLGRPYTPIRKAGKVTTTYEQISGVKPEVKMPLTDKAMMEIFKEVSKIKQIIPKKRAIRKIRGRVIKYDIEREIPSITYDIEKEIARRTGFSVRTLPTYKKPEPVPKLDIKELMKDLERIYIKPDRKPKKVTAWDLKRHEKKVKELRSYLQELSGKERIAMSKAARDIYGEPIVKAVPLAQIEKELIKGVIKKPPVEAVVGAIPPVKPIKNIVKDISKLESKLYEKVRVKDRLRLGVGVAARERERLKEATQLGQQMVQVEKAALKEVLQLGLTSKQLQKLRQAQRMGLKQALLPKQLLKMAMAPSLVKPLRFKVPPPPAITIPVVPFPDIDIISKEILKKKIKKRKRKKVWTYTPSFTAKALGIKPIKLGSVISIKKLLKKMQTGLEIRAPVVVTR